MVIDILNCNAISIKSLKMIKTHFTSECVQCSVNVFAFLHMPSLRFKRNILHVNIFVGIFNEYGNVYGSKRKVFSMVLMIEKSVVKYRKQQRCLRQTYLCHVRYAE